jgi:cell division protein FtsI/penicillin-binding protein 2
MNSFHKKREKVNPKKNSIENLNFYIVGFFLLVIGFGVLFQSFRWQILYGDKYASLAKAQYLESTDKATTRGIIYANDNTVLAVDQPVWDVYASLSSLKEERDLFFQNKEKYISTVSAILALKQEDISKKLTQDFMYVKLKTDLPVEKKKALEEAEIFPNGKENFYKGFGFHFVKREDRVYPNGKLASHILGFIGQTEQGVDVGQYGIEGFYFSDILGQKGYTYEEKDSLGNVILTSEYDPILPRQGKSFKLTINPIIQMKVEAILKKGVIDQQAKSGTVVLMDPNNGAILAMANYPDYNPNEYWKTSEGWIYRNKAIADVYEYGSVNKPISVAIALESGKVKEDYKCNDKTGSLKLYDKTIYTWNRQPNGILTLGGMLEKSNNPCIVQMALITGHPYYYPKLKEFGIGQFLGVGLQDEATGHLKPYDEWTKLDLATTSFGQSISATPLQIVSALSTIANEGNRMRPQIIAEVQEENDVLEIKPQIISQPISSNTASLVAKMMEGVVRSGEPKVEFNTLLPNYSIAGKTGTAQIPRKDGPGYYTDRTNGTFVGFSPVKEAKMIMLVRMEEPKNSSFAVSTAVPVWIDIYKAIADDLEIAKGR